MNLKALYIIIPLFFYGCSQNHPSPKKPPPPKVKVMKVSASEVPIYIETYGHLEAYSVVNIVPKVSGFLVSKHYTDGIYIKQGSLLLSLYDKEYKAAVEQAKGTLDSSIAKRDYYTKQQKRNLPLVKKNFISKDAYDQIVMNLEEAEGEVTQNRGAYEQALINLEYTKIYAPYGGIMGNTAIDPGNYIPAGTTSPIVNINKIDPISANFYISEKYLHILQKNLNKHVVYINQEQEGTKSKWIQGKLNFVDNMVNEQTGLLLVKGSYANSDQKLWPGQYISVRIEIEKIKGFVVPSKAIQIGIKGPFVYVIGKDQKAKIKQVSIATIQGDNRVIDCGLSEEDVIVTDGQLNLYPQAKVRIVSK